MAVGSDDTLTVWLNGREVYRFSDRRGFHPEQARFDVRLVKGVNRVLIHCGNRGGPWQFSVAVTDAADYRVLERPGRRRWLQPRDVSRRRDQRAGAMPAAAAGYSRSEGPGLHQVPRRRQGRGQRRAGAGEHRRRSIRATSSSPRSCIPRRRSPRAIEPRRSPSPTAASSPGSSATRRPMARSRSRMPRPSSIKVAKDEIDDRKRSDVSVMPTGLARGSQAGRLRGLDRVSRNS